MVTRCRRRLVSGRSTPSSAASLAEYGPAASTTANPLRVAAKTRHGHAGRLDCPGCRGKPVRGLVRGQPAVLCAPGGCGYGAAHERKAPSRLAPVQVFHVAQSERLLRSNPAAEPLGTVLLGGQEQVALLPHADVAILQTRLVAESLIEPDRLAHHCEIFRLNELRAERLHRLRGRQAGKPGQPFDDDRPQTGAAQEARRMRTRIR